MDEKTLLRFIEKIVSSKDEDIIYHSLNELIKILTKNGVDQKLIHMVKELQNVRPEAVSLGTEVVRGKKLTKEEVDIVIKRGKDRIRREEEMRRMSHC